VYLIKSFYAVPLLHKWVAKPNTVFLKVIAWAVVLLMGITSLVLFVLYGHQLALPQKAPSKTSSLTLLSVLDGIINCIDGVTTVIFLLTTFLISKEMCMGTLPPMEYRFTLKHQPTADKMGSAKPLLDPASVIVEARRTSLRGGNSPRRLGYYTEYSQEVIQKLCPDRPHDVKVPCVVRVPHNEEQSKRFADYFMEIVRLNMASLRSKSLGETLSADEYEWISEDTPWVNENKYDALMSAAPLRRSRDALSVRTPASALSLLGTEIPFGDKFGDSGYLLPAFMRTKRHTCFDHSLGYTILALLLVMMKLTAAFTWW